MPKNRRGNFAYVKFFLCVFLALSLAMTPTLAYATGVKGVANATANAYGTDSSAQENPGLGDAVSENDISENVLTEDATHEDAVVENSLSENLELREPQQINRNEYLAEFTTEDVPEIKVHPSNIIESTLSLFGMDFTSLKDSGHTLYLKHTIADDKALYKYPSFDSFFSSDIWLNSLIAQYELSADLLDPGDGSDWFIALANPSDIRGESNACDYVFTEMNNNGVQVEGPWIDLESGIAYVPKSLYYKDGEEIPFALQAQILLPGNLDTHTDCTFDVNINCNDLRVKALNSYSIKANRYDISVSIPIVISEFAEKVTLSNIDVKLNGSDSSIDLIDGTNASYDPKSGKLELFISPSEIASLDIEIKAPSVLDMLTEKAIASTSAESLSFVPEVKFEGLNFDTLKIGNSYEFDCDLAYWWPNPDPDDHAWEACVETGQYCYSWVNDPDSLYEYIAWQNGANWNGVEEGAVSNFHVTPDGNQASRNYFNYIFLLENMTTDDQNWYSENWPINCVYDYGKNYSHFGLQCCHTKNPVSVQPSGSDQGTMVMRVLDLQTQIDRPYIVLGFVGPAVANQPGVGIYKFDIEAFGRIQLDKSSGIPDITDSNKCYTLKGIKYDVFSDDACTKLVTNIILDENGHGTSKGLKDGTYYVKENLGSCLGKGYAYDASIYHANVSTGCDTDLSVKDIPQSATLDLLLAKQDSDTECGNTQGDGTFDGAEFTVEFYPAHFDTPEKAVASGKPLRRWVFKTDASGTSKLDEEHQISGDKLFFDSKHNPCLPIGCVHIFESKAPQGYLLSERSGEIRNITSRGSLETITDYVYPIISEDVIRGGVKIHKLDLESKLESPLGAATFEGTTFSIINRSKNSVSVNGVFYNPGEEVTKIVYVQTDAHTSSDALPYGTYGIKEVFASKGYLLTDQEERVFNITENNKMVEIAPNSSPANQVVRGDLELIKCRASDQSRMAGVPFRITSNTTGESHVLLTDSNGCLKTSSSWIKHTSHTNANDNALDEDGHFDSSKSIKDAGIWFGKTQNGDITQPDDSLGALIYDTYTIEELPCSVNDGLVLVTLPKVSVSTHALSIDLGTIENRAPQKPHIETKARNATSGTSMLTADFASSVVDRVSFEYLEPGHSYRMDGIIVDEDGNPLTGSDNENISASIEFTPEDSKGYVDVVFEFDSSKHAGKRIVCYESLVDLSSEKVVADHKDLLDFEQSLLIAKPAIGTHATIKSTGTKEFDSTATAKVVDEVNYTNLVPGKEYTVYGMVMRKFTNLDGDTEAEIAKNPDGRAITTQKTVIPEDASGTFEIEYEIAPSTFSPGDELVIYETLEDNGIELVSHTDPNNAAQSLRAQGPVLKTTATDLDDSDHELSLSQTNCIVDKVQYSNLDTAYGYTIKGTVMQVVKEDGSDISIDVLRTDNSQILTSTVTFQPETSSGYVNVEFPIDTTAIPGKRLVVYEELIKDGEVIASHKAPLDESQTVYIETPPIFPDVKLPTTLAQTGDGKLDLMFLLISIAGLSSAIAMYSFTKRQKLLLSLKRLSGLSRKDNSSVQ